MTNITLSALKQGSAEITVTSTADPTVTARIPAVISPADQATPVKLTDGMWSLPGDGGDGFLNAADKKGIPRSGHDCNRQDAGEDRPSSFPRRAVE